MGVDRALKREYTWSYSKSLALSSCPRSYYYSYLWHDSGGHKGIQNRMQPLSAISGVIFHEIISNQIDLWKCGELPNIKLAKAETESMMSEIFDHPETHILEAFNGFDIGSSSRPICMRIKKNIDTFFLYIWPHFKDHEYISHEALEKYWLDDIQISIMIDLCTRNRDGQLVITDWKTGDLSRCEDANLQLTAYVLWAEIVRHEKLDNIIMQIANPRLGSIDRMIPDRKSIDNVYQLISYESKIKMSSTDMGIFYPVPTLDRCAGCLHYNKCSEAINAIQSAKINHVNSPMNQ
jgi:hypothetical protein